MEPLNPKLKRLLEYMKTIRDYQGNYDLYKQYEADILSVSHEDLFLLFKTLLDEGDKQADILTYVDKMMHVFGVPLLPLQQPMPEDSFLDHLSQENRALEVRLEAIKDILIAQKRGYQPDVLRPMFEALESFHNHYVKIQNILFPYLEKKDDRYSALSILWSLHDLTKQHLKDLIHQLDLEPFNIAQFSIALGHYFFDAYGLIQKEEMILFQIVLKLCNEEELEDMRAQSFEYPFCYIDLPKKRERKSDVPDKSPFEFKTETGQLSFEQLELMLDMLPIDCTLIDENNKVRYFNKAKDRVFPRSPAVIGRDVRNCHPAESVHIVDKIIEAFRHNERDHADFWIQMRGKFIYIRYFALRDINGQYKGTLEVTQVVDEIRALEGQKRLLEWD